MKRYKPAKAQILHELSQLSTDQLIAMIAMCADHDSSESIAVRLIKEEVPEGGISEMKARLENLIYPLYRN